MNKRNDFTKECITEALLKLMKTKTLEDISIIELTNKAGVSRNSFYRNFDSKKDVLEKYMIILIEEWGKEFEKSNDPEAFSKTLLNHYYKYKDFYLLLYRRGLSMMIYENLRSACKLDETTNNIERYGKSMLAGLLFGWLDEWMRKGMSESPEEIEILRNTINKS